MEFGTGFMGLPMPTMRSFNSKAEALQFAIEFTASSSMGVATELIDALYDMVVKLKEEGVI